MNTLKAIEILNAAADLQEEAHDSAEDVLIIGVSLSAGSCRDCKEIHILSGIEKLAKELNVELLYQEETDKYNKSRYFLHRGLRVFQIND